MCGICGQFNFASNQPVDQATIIHMANSIAHRGPNDEGFFVSGPIGLGFRRLSIIDLASGHQPMSDADETVWVIFNAADDGEKSILRPFVGSEFSHVSTIETRTRTKAIGGPPIRKARQS